MRKFIRLALVASILYGTGAHWAALQVYAWSTMRAAGVKDPCKVCKIVAKGSAEQAPSGERSAPSADFAFTVPEFAGAESPVSVHAEMKPPSIPSPTYRPPTPPPDSGLPA